MTTQVPNIVKLRSSRCKKQKWIWTCVETKTQIKIRQLKKKQFLPQASEWVFKHFNALLPFEGMQIVTWYWSFTTSCFFCRKDKVFGTARNPPIWFILISSVREMLSRKQTYYIGNGFTHTQALYKNSFKGKRRIYFRSFGDVTLKV